jgi:hypothetical protein
MNVVLLVSGTTKERMTTRKTTKREREPKKGGTLADVGERNIEIYDSTLSHDVSKSTRRPCALGLDSVSHEYEK